MRTQFRTQETCLIYAKICFLLFDRLLCLVDNCYHLVKHYIRFRPYLQVEQLQLNLIFTLIQVFKESMENVAAATLVQVLVVIIVTISSIYVYLIVLSNSKNATWSSTRVRSLEMMIFILQMLRRISECGTHLFLSLKDGM